MKNEECIREIKERIEYLRTVVEKQIMETTRPEPTSLEMDELERLEKELNRRKGL